VKERGEWLGLGIFVLLLGIALKLFYCDIFYCPHPLTPEQEKRVAVIVDKMRADICAKMKRSQKTDNPKAVFVAEAFCEPQSK
jgi:hypothetical protein